LLVIITPEYQAQMPPRAKAFALAKTPAEYVHDLTCDSGTALRDVLLRLTTIDTVMADIKEQVVGVNVKLAGLSMVWNMFLENFRTMN
jgi:hypothetical protein